MYHFHIAVITSTYIWTSGWNLLAKECEFIFTYAGGLNFHMVCNKVEGFPRPQKRALNLSTKPKVQHGRSRTKRPKTQLSTEDSTKESKSRLHKHTKRHKSARLVRIPLPYKVVKPKERQTKTSRHAASHAFSVSLDNVLKSRRDQKCLAAPKHLKENNPFAGHLSNPSELEDPGSNHTSNYNDEEKNIETIKTKAGQLAIAKHGLVKKECKVKKITCPVCEEVIYT